MALYNSIKAYILFTSESDGDDGEEARQGLRAVPLLRPPAGQDRLHAPGPRRKGARTHREEHILGPCIFDVWKFGFLSFTLTAFVTDKSIPVQGSAKRQVTFCIKNFVFSTSSINW